MSDEPTIRDDDSQWLINNEDPVTAGMEAIEIVALFTAGMLLTAAEDVEMRALGNVMLKWSDARQRTMRQGTDAEQIAVDHAALILNYMGSEMDVVPKHAMGELHAVAFSFDQRLNAAGINGDGWFQEIARGEHGR